MCRIYIALFVFVVSQNAAEETTPHSTATPLSTSSTLALNETLLHKCLSMEGFKGTKFSNLNAMEQGQVLGCMNREYANVSDLLEKERGRCDSYRVLLGIRNEFENELMNALYPESFPATKDQYLKCVFVLVSQTGQMVKRYRRIIKKAGFTFDEFCSLGDKEIYSPKSKIVHKIQIPDHCLTIANYLFITRHDEELRNFIREGHKRSQLIATILKLRQARLNSKGKFGAVKDPETTGKCILVSNVPFVKNPQQDTDPMTSFPQSTIVDVPDKQQKKNRYMPAKQIRAIFRAEEAKKGVQTICETKESNDERRITGNVLVEFSKPRHAALGLLEHQNAVNGYDVTMEFVLCEDFKCADEDLVKYITA